MAVFQGTSVGCESERFRQGPDRTRVCRLHRSQIRLRYPEARGGRAQGLSDQDVAEALACFVTPAQGNDGQDRPGVWPSRGRPAPRNDGIARRDALNGPRSEEVPHPSARDWHGTPRVEDRGETLDPEARG